MPVDESDKFKDRCFQLRECITRLFPTDRGITEQWRRTVSHATGDKMVRHPRGQAGLGDRECCAFRMRFSQGIGQLLELQSSRFLQDQ